MPISYNCIIMSYQFTEVADTAALLLDRLAGLDDPQQIMRSPELKALYDQIKTMPDSDKRAFGQEVNSLKQSLQAVIESKLESNDSPLPVIDVTSPWDINTSLSTKPTVKTALSGSKHPLMTELDYITSILSKMGFSIVESRQLDDDFHMFESLNFPEGHPARDDFDTFMTDEGLIAPAHTSTMQHRVLKHYAPKLLVNEPIAVAIPGRVFRNEDLDVTHEHTFYQLEGVYVDKGVTVGNLIAVLRQFMGEYFGQQLEAKIQPFYFPFTEPSFEFAIERPEALKKGNSHADQWLELLGCGMIHPRVLEMAGIDPTIYSGFAWGGGIERLVLMKYGIEDIRHFESGNLAFLKQFA